MSEWESLLWANQAKAHAPADAPDIAVPGLHLYLIAGQLGNQGIYDTLQAAPQSQYKKARVYPQPGTVATLNAIPDPSWAGRSRPSAIGGTAHILTQGNVSEFAENRWTVDQYSYHYLTTNGDPSATVPAGTVELRLCTTPARDVGVFARLQFVARDQVVDAYSVYPPLVHSGFFTVRNGQKTYYDLQLTYGTLGSSGNVHDLTYYYLTLGNAADFPNNLRIDDYRVPIELAVFQPTADDTPVAVVRDPQVRDGWCHVFSAPNYCQTAGDPFMRCFGQVVLDGTTGTHETYPEARLDATVNNTFGLTDAYVRSIAYNVGASTYTPDAPAWMVNLPGMAKAANNVGFTRDAPGFGEEATPLEWPLDVVGDHNRRRLTDGIAGVTADATPNIITVVDGGASAVTLTFAGTPPYADVVGRLPADEFASVANLPDPNSLFEEETGQRFYISETNQVYELTFESGDEVDGYEEDTPYDIGLINGQTFTLDSTQTQNLFLGSGGPRVISTSADVPTADPTGLSYPTVLDTRRFDYIHRAVSPNGPIGAFATEQQAQEYVDQVNAIISEKQNRLDALSAGMEKDELFEALYDEDDGYSLAFGVQYTLRVEEWQGEAAVASGRPANASDGNDIFDSSAAEDADHDRFIAAQHDRRNNATSQGTQGQIAYRQQLQSHRLDAHFSFRYGQYLTAAWFLYPVIAVFDNFPGGFSPFSGFWIAHTATALHTKTFPGGNGISVWQAVEHATAARSFHPSQLVNGEIEIQTGGLPNISKIKYVP